MEVTKDYVKQAQKKDNCRAGYGIRKQGLKNCPRYFEQFIMPKVGIEPTYP
jgi:hypothetical protein